MALTAEQLLTSIWAALRRIEDNLALPPAPLELPAPHVTVSAPDLTDLTQTLMGLRPGPTALELARAIADVLPPSVAKDASPSIEMYDAIVRALERLDFRMQAPPSQGYIGGSVNLQPDQTVGVTSFPTGETGLAKDATLLRRYGTHTTKAGLANTTGNNTLHTPASGKKIRLYWIALSASQDNTAENLAVVQFGAAGADVYRWRMGNPGAFSGSRTVEGAVDEPLILELANTQPIDWNVDLEEV